MSGRHQEIETPHRDRRHRVITTMPVAIRINPNAIQRHELFSRLNPTPVVGDAADACG